MFGTRGRDLVYDHVARNYSFGREDIPLHLDDFLALLEDTFSTGSRTIGRTIIRRLYGKLGWAFEVVPGFEFNDYLESARARIGRELFERAKAKHRESVGNPDVSS